MVGITQQYRGAAAAVLLVFAPDVAVAGFTPDVAVAGVALSETNNKPMVACGPAQAGVQCPVQILDMPDTYRQIPDVGYLEGRIYSGLLYNINVPRVIYNADSIVVESRKFIDQPFDSGRSFEPYDPADAQSNEICRSETVRLAMSYLSINTAGEVIVGPRLLDNGEVVRDELLDVDALRDKIEYHERALHDLKYTQKLENGSFSEYWNARMYSKFAREYKNTFFFLFFEDAYKIGLLEKSTDKHTFDPIFPLDDFQKGIKKMRSLYEKTRANIASPRAIADIAALNKLGQNIIENFLKDETVRWPVHPLSGEDLVRLMEKNPTVVPQNLSQEYAALWGQVDKAAVINILLGHALQQMDRPPEHDIRNPHQPKITQDLIREIEKSLVALKKARSQLLGFQPDTAWEATVPRCTKEFSAIFNPAPAVL